MPTHCDSARRQYDLIVIGAGISGLAVAKHALSAGLSVLVLEQTFRVGGIWAFDPDKPGGVMYSTRINVSKHNYAFAGFPFPDGAPDFPDNREMHKYISDYVQHHGILEHIRFGTQVIGLEQSAQDRWVVSTRTTDGHTADSWSTRFVSIASGHHSVPLYPDIPGLNDFNGTVLHSAQYKGNRFCDVDDKDVVVVGLGNSGVDVACDVAERARSVTVSARSGAWVLSNHVFGYPADLYAPRLIKWLPWQWVSAAYEKAILLTVGHPDKFGLKPKHRALRSHPTLGTRFIHLLQNRQIEAKGEIQRIVGDRVIFGDECSHKADTIILCTGYQISFPFLPEEIRSAVFGGHVNDVNLYMNMFVPEIGSSLSFIGLVQPESGGLLSMSEMQARWLIELIKSKVALPPVRSMKSRIEQDKERNLKQYAESPRHTIQRSPIAYNDEIASWIGQPVLQGRSLGLRFRMIFGTGGVNQWTARSDDQDDQRLSAAIRSVRVPPAMKMLGCIAVSGAVLLAGLVCIFLVWVGLLLFA